MNTAIRALMWELIRKNLVVFPALVLILAFGAVMSYLVAHADPEVWWNSMARGAAFIAFLASILLGFTSFSLMESYEGWRMNSMTTRWFVLPLRTGSLVAAPLVLAWCLIAILILVWAPILNRATPGLDMVYILLALWIGIVATQALAWSVPRRPGQYWSMAAMVFLATLILSLAPETMKHWATWRLKMMGGLCALIPMMAGFAWWAARCNRCGDWPGEVPVERLLNRLRWRGARTRDFRGPSRALFWSDSQPGLRAFILSWLVIVGVLIGYVSVVITLQRPNDRFRFDFICPAALELLPLVGVIWLAGFGLFLGCEPSVGFRTGLSSYRATLPVRASTMAAMRMTTLMLAWGFVWAPLLALHISYEADYRGIPAKMAAGLALNASAALAYKMAVSLNLLVGALPLFLRGRCEGFPTMLLAAMGSWGWTYLLVSFLDVDENPGKRWIIVGILLTIKLAITGWSLGHSWRTGQTAWRFVVVILCSWLVATGSLIWIMPSWQTGGAWRAVSLVLLVPLARLVYCPLAVASNRHR